MERTSFEAEIFSARCRAFSMAASLALWKSDTNSEGRKCLAWARSSSAEMLVVLPCAYCSATHAPMCLTPGCLLPTGSMARPVRAGTFSLIHCATPALPDLSVTMTRMDLFSSFSVSKML